MSKPSIAQNIRVLYCICILAFKSSKVYFGPLKNNTLKIIWQIVKGNYDCPLVGMKIVQLSGWAQRGLPGLNLSLCHLLGP